MLQCHFLVTGIFSAENTELSLRLAARAKQCFPWLNVTTFWHLSWILQIFWRTSLEQLGIKKKNIRSEVHCLNTSILNTQMTWRIEMTCNDCLSSQTAGIHSTRQWEESTSAQLAGAVPVTPGELRCLRWPFWKPPSPQDAIHPELFTWSALGLSHSSERRQATVCKVSAATGWGTRDCTGQQGTRAWKCSKFPSASEKQAGSLPLLLLLLPHYYFGSYLTHILDLVSPLRPAVVFLTYIIECLVINWICTR